MDNYRRKDSFTGPFTGGGIETERFNKLYDQGRKPDLKTGMRLYLVVFLLLLVIGSVVQGLNLEIGMIITQWVLILLPALWILNRYRVDRVTFVRIRPLKFRFIPVIILLSASFWVLNMIIAAGMVSGLMELGYEPIVVLEPPQTFQHYLVYLFVISISAGICEEILFRGTIMPAMEDHGLVPAIVFSSLLFALFHISFLNLISTFMIGAVIAVVVIKTGSLWGGIFYHMLNNLFAITYLYFAGQQETATEVDPHAYWIALPLLILALAGAYSGLKLLQKHADVKPLLKDRAAGWLPRGWFNGILVIALFLFLLMAMIELVVGFGWFGLDVL